MLDFVSKRHWFLLASAILVVAGLISVLIPGGLKLGADFKGGVSATVMPKVTLAPKAGETLTIDQVKQKLTDLGFPQVAEAVEQVESEAGTKFLIPPIPTLNLSQADQGKLEDGLAEIGQVEATLTLSQVKDKLNSLGFSQAAGKVQQLGQTETDREFFIRSPALSDTEQEKLVTGLKELDGVGRVDVALVSSIVASETARNAAIAVGVAMAAMLVYMIWAFHKMPSPVRYGTCAIIALLFNVLMVLGVFSFLGRTLDWEIDPMFITAMLAIIGYSINDTIVVLDRVRENVGRLGSVDISTIANHAIAGTITRSLNTSITTVLAVLVVYVFVGGPIETFLVALLIGIVAGTYSSIFIASQLLVVWETGKWRGRANNVPVTEKAGIERQG
jgi:preprotein translocase subunit SecF